MRTCEYAPSMCWANRLAMNDEPLSVTRNGFFFSGPHSRSPSARAEMLGALADAMLIAGGTDLLVVADDIEANRAVLDSLLEMAGVKVVMAKNGKEAVEAFQRAKPDLIFMDVRMPVMDGLEATRLIKDRWPEVKLVVLLGSGKFFSAGFAIGAKGLGVAAVPLRRSEGAQRFLQSGKTALQPLAICRACVER